MASEIRNRLMQMLQDPASFKGSPGFQFAMDSGTQALNRRAAATGIRGSGNALAALTKYGTGLAQQDYGNEVDRLGRLYATEDAGDVARTRNANDLTLGQGRLGLDRELGTGRLALDRDLGEGRLGLDAGLGYGRLQNDRDLGFGAQATTRRGQDLDYSLGSTQAANSYDLGRRTNDTNAQRNWYDYDIGGRRADTDAYSARTARGTAQSEDWYRRDSRRGFWNPPAPRPAGTY